MPKDGPALVLSADDNCVADCIQVLREVRRTGRAFEVDREVSAPRVPKLLSELDCTLQLFSADRRSREQVLEKIPERPKSSCPDDDALNQARDVSLMDEDA